MTHPPPPHCTAGISEKIVQHTVTVSILLLLILLLQQGRGCESVREHYLPSLIHAISCSLGSKNGNALHCASNCGQRAVRHCTLRGVQKIPWARGPAQIILINCGTEQHRLPLAPRIPIYTSPHQYQHQFKHRNIQHILIYISMHISTF